MKRRAVIVILVVCCVPCVGSRVRFLFDYMPGQIAISEHWGVVSDKRHSIEVGRTDEGGCLVNADTLPPPEPRAAFSFSVLHNEGRDAEFLVYTSNWQDSTTSLWLLNAEIRTFQRLLRIGWEYEGGATLSACRGTRVLVSAGRSHRMPFLPSVTYLVDTDSGRVVRTYEGLHLGNEAPLRYPRYDDTTESIWILPNSINPEHYQATDRPTRMIRMDCASGDTTWVDEHRLFGGELADYWVSDVYQGHMLVGTRDGLSDEERGHTSRMLLVDLVELRPVAEWKLSWEGKPDVRGFMITEDLRGMVYYEWRADKTVHRWGVRAGETEPVEVDLAGGRMP